MRRHMSQGLFGDAVVWITGASSGIGRELARRFAEEGATLALSARRQSRLDELGRELRDRGTNALVVPCDVRDEVAVEKTVERIVGELGRLDVAVADAGFAVTGRIETLGAEDWKRQLDTNVVGLAMTARYALPALRKTGGRLVLVGSVASMVPTPGSGAYSASKAAVRAIGQTLAVECAGSGVTVTTIHPGFVHSEIAQVDNFGEHHADRKDRRPAQWMWSTGRAARVMVRAIHSRKREYVFTGHGKAGAFLGRHTPGLVHWALARSPGRSVR